MSLKSAVRLVKAAPAHSKPWSVGQYVPEIESLEDRMVTVEISEINVDLIKKLVRDVASVACFVNFLPLGNRVGHYFFKTLI